MTSAIHIGIPNPTRYQKEVLKLSIETIQLLKRYEKFKRIKSEKEVYKKQFTKNIRDIDKLFLALANLPKVEKPKRIKLFKKMKAPPKKLAKEQVYLTDLEKDIQELKEKLDQLD